MLSHSKLSALAVLSSILAIARTQNPIPSDFSLLDKDSSMKIRSFPWEPEKPLNLDLNFKTVSYSGQLFSLKATDEVTAATYFKLTAKIERRFLKVQLTNAADEILASVENIRTDVTAESQEEFLPLSIMLNLADAALAVNLNGKEARELIENPPTFGKTSRTHLIIGKTVLNDQLSIAGCISRINLSVDEQELALESEEQFMIEDGCSTACLPNPCVIMDACVNNYGELVCDCARTGKEGSQCDLDATVVSLDGSQYLEVPPKNDTEARSPKRILISFRTTSSDLQVLLSAPINLNYKEQTLTATVTENTAVVQVEEGSEDRIEFTDVAIADGKWHNLDILIDYAGPAIEVRLDEVSKAVALLSENAPLGSDPSFSGPVKIGGAPSLDGFNGCLKEVYIGTQSILSQLKSAASGVVLSSGSANYGCEIAPVEGTVIENESENPDVPDVPMIDPNDEEFVDYGATTEAGDGENVPVEPVPLPDNNENEEATTVEGNNDGGWVGPVQETCDGVKCMQDTKCFVDGQTGEAKCDCQNTGYAGRFCQFAVIPRNCEEARAMNGGRSGVYRIDMDGEGPLAATYVNCVFGQFSRDTLTTVSNNFPNHTVLRAGMSYKDTILAISYQLMSLEQLKYLVSASGSCSQYIQYNCVKAPLKFGTKTWFSSQGKSEFGQIGDVAGKCPCSEGENCEGVVGSFGCNCDANQDVPRMDEGYVSGDLAGITSVTVLQEPEQKQGTMTIGPLECRGTKSEKSVTLKTSHSYLSTKNWGGSSLAFWMRTSNTDGLILRQDGDSAEFVELRLKEGHVMQVKYKFTKATVEELPAPLKAVSTTRLNDGNWHNVQLNIKDGEMMLAVDGNRVFRRLGDDESSRISGDAFIGGAQSGGEGFVGCFKGFEMDGNPLDLTQYITSEGGAIEGCQDQCSGMPCQNNAECVEDYAGGSYTCVCANPWAHSGKNCENDVNEGTEVSIRDIDDGYVQLRDLDNHPVRSTISLSFRTDQSSALLLYAFDQFYNFVQIHMMDDNHISLTVNYNNSIKRCTIKSDNEFSKMEWTQVAVSYSDEDTTLNVDHLFCSIDGVRVVSDQYISEWETGDQYLDVFPPRSPHSPTNPEDIQPFNVLNVGGVWKNLNRKRRFRRALKPIWSSRIPNLLGCVRGLKIGQNSVDLTSALNPGKAMKGCTVGCQDLGCRNGGHCKVPWANKFDNPTCDCTQTSYVGPACTQDSGLNFDGATSLKFLAESAILKTRIRFTSTLPPTFRFTFSSNSQSDRPQAMAELNFKNQMKLGVYLHPDRLAFNANSTSPYVIASAAQAYPGNYSNGQRHFVFMKFRDNEVFIKVDGVSQILAVAEEFAQMKLEDLSTIVLGGSLDSENITGITSYQGCMSNAIIDLRVNQADIKFTPLDYYSTDTSSKYASDVQISPAGGSATFGPCAGNTDIGAPTAPPPTFPPWNVPLKRNAYIGPQVEKKENGKGNMGVAIALIVILLLVVLGVGGYVYYVKCVRNKRKSADVTRTYTAVDKAELDSPPPDKLSAPRMTPPDPSSIPEETVPLRTTIEEHPEPPASPNYYSSNGDQPMYNSAPTPHPSSAAAPGVDQLPNNPDLPEGTMNLDERRDSSQPPSLWIAVDASTGVLELAPPPPPPPPRSPGTSLTGSPITEEKKEEANKENGKAEKHKEPEKSEMEEFPPPPTEEELNDPGSPSSVAFRKDKRRDFEGGDTSPASLVSQGGDRPGSTSLVRRASSRKQPRYVPVPKI